MPETTRCKFRCSGREETRGTVWDVEGKSCGEGTLYEFKFSVVATGSEENRRFFASTPWGECVLKVVRDRESFQIGREYYFDISPADATG